MPSLAALAGLAAAVGTVSASHLNFAAPTTEEMRAVLAKSRTGPRFAQLEDAPTYEPQQLHISLTGEVGGMLVNFVTMSDCQGSVQYGPTGSTTTVTIPTYSHTYTAGFGWSGRIHMGTMTNLAPGAPYTYSVGCTANSTTAWSEPRGFVSAPAPGPTLVSRIAVTADQGTIVPLGWAVADQITFDHLDSGTPFDMSLISGDLAYATVDPPHNEVQWTWDCFSNQVEPYASTAPQMVVVGNHENTPGTITNSSGTFNVDFAAFTARFQMPGNGNGNFWHSYDFKNVHYVAACSECDYSAGSPQLAWLEADLAAANANRAVVPWVIFMLHRPIYSADNDGWSAHRPGCPLAVAFEPLLLAHSVDLVIQGHEHCWERSAAVNNGTVVTLPTGPDNVYTNPGAPIYIVQGTSGADQEETFVTPTPAWSLVQTNNVYGYGKMIVTGAERLDYTFIDINGEVHDTWSIVKTPAPAVVA